MIAAATIATGATRPEFTAPQGLGLAFSKVLWALLNYIGNALGSAASATWDWMKGAYNKTANFLSENVGQRLSNLVEYGTLKNRAELAQYTVESAMALDDPNKAFEALIAAKEKGIIGDKEMAEARATLYARQASAMNGSDSTTFDMGLLMQDKGGKGVAEFFVGSRGSTGLGIQSAERAADTIAAKFIVGNRDDAVAELEKAGVKVTLSKDRRSLVIDPNQSAENIALAQALQGAMTKWDSGDEKVHAQMRAESKTKMTAYRMADLNAREVGPYRIGYDAASLGYPTNTITYQGFPVRYFTGEAKIMSYAESAYTAESYPDEKEVAGKNHYGGPSDAAYKMDHNFDDNMVPGATTPFEIAGITVGQKVIAGSIPKELLNTDIATDEMGVSVIMKFYDQKGNAYYAGVGHNVEINEKVYNAAGTNQKLQGGTLIGRSGAVGLIEDRGGAIVHTHYTFRDAKGNTLDRNTAVKILLGLK